MQFGAGDRSEEVIWESAEVDTQFGTLQRQRCRAVVTAGLAFEILAYCDSTMADPRILRMRRLMQQEHGAPAGAGSHLRPNASRCVSPTLSGTQQPRSLDHASHQPPSAHSSSYVKAPR